MAKCSNIFLHKINIRMIVIKGCFNVLHVSDPDIFVYNWCLVHSSICLQALSVDRLGEKEAVRVYHSTQKP